MTNWVETVQSQNHAEGTALDPADQLLYDQYNLSQSSDSGSDSDFLDEQWQKEKQKLKQKRQAKRQNADGSSSESDSSGSDGESTSDLNSREESKLPPIGRAAADPKGKRTKKKLLKEKKRLEAEATQMMR